MPEGKLVEKPVSWKQWGGGAVGVAGSVAGLVFAHRRKSPWYGYLGWMILGGMVGGSVGWVLFPRRYELKKG